MPIPRDTIVRLGSDELPLFVRLPQKQPRGVMIAVHGNTRQALLHALRFAPHAEANALLLIAPLFERQRHPRYRVLDRHADDLLTHAVDDLLQRLGVTDRKWLWFGHSAGAQFVHRYVLRKPQRVARAVLSAAGWYTLPRYDLPFPHGVAGPHEIDLAAALLVPQRVYVGAADVHTGEALRSDPALDLAQGQHRLARAHTFVQAMRQAALAHGLPARVTLRELRSAGHDFDANVRAAGLARRAVRYLLKDDHDSATTFVDPDPRAVACATGVGSNARARG